MSVPSFSRIEIINANLSEAPGALRKLAGDLETIRKSHSDGETALVLSHQAIKLASQKLRGTAK